MSIKINIHKTHRQFTGNAKIVEVDGKNIGDCLDRLIDRFPDMKKALFGKNGKLRNVVEIYLNMESTYPDELGKAVKNGDEIHITLMLIGG